MSLRALEFSALQFYSASQIQPASETMQLSLSGQRIFSSYDKNDIHIDISY